MSRESPSGINRLFLPYPHTNNGFFLAHYVFNKFPEVPEYAKIVVVGFVALRPKSTAMVIAGRSVHLTTLFPGQA